MSGGGHQMNPGIGLREAAFAIEDEEGQRVIRIVTVLDQQLSTKIALHRNQRKGRLARVMNQPPCPAAAEVAQPIEHNNAGVSAHNLKTMMNSGLSESARRHRYHFWRGMAARLALITAALQTAMRAGRT